MKYYTARRLHIYYTEVNYLTYELERRESTRYDSVDEDEEDYEEKKKEYLEKWISPILAKPITIYRNGSFTKSLCETKYKIMVENEITNHNILLKCRRTLSLIDPDDPLYVKNQSDSPLTLGDIIKIVKVEEAGIY
jgi:hypothetical protein